MENHYETPSNSEATDPGLRIMKYSPYQPSTRLSSSWFDLRVFYVRVSNFQVDDLTPEFLTLSHKPLGPDTLLDVNGARSSICSDGFSSLLRRDRVDKKSEEVTFVSTDSIRLMGSKKFDVFDKEDVILSGVLEMSSSNGFVGESKSNAKHWNIDCESEITTGTGFLKGKHVTGPESPLPTIEVYVAGCYLGTPIILTKTLQLCLQKKHNRKGTLDAIPEYGTTEREKNLSTGLDSQVADFSNYKPENDEDYDNMDSEDGELSWFNAGVRVGVGIGLGICLGLGIGLSLLVRSYQATTGSFKRRLS